MVRLHRLPTTRCASTMATGTILQGLLHGRQHTHTPRLLPQRPPKHGVCPWTAKTLPNDSSPLRTPTYSDVLRRVPLTTSHRYSRHSTNCSSQSTFSSSLVSIKYPKRGTQQWHLCASQLTVPLPSSTYQSPSTAIPHCLDSITNWLPISYQRHRAAHYDITTSFSHGPLPHVPNDSTPTWSDNTDKYYDYPDTTSTDPIPDACFEDIPHPPTSTDPDDHPNANSSAPTCLSTCPQ